MFESRNSSKHVLNSTLVLKKKKQCAKCLRDNKKKINSIELNMVNMEGVSELLH